MINCDSPYPHTLSHKVILAPNLPIFGKFGSDVCLKTVHDMNCVVCFIIVMVAIHIHD